MKPVTTYLLCFLFFCFLLETYDLKAQSTPDSYIKIGGLYSFNKFPAYYLNQNENIGYQISIEYERNFGKIKFITNCIQFDYVYQKPISSRNVYLGYGIKFYPCYWKYKQPNRGIILGLIPIFIFRDPKNDFTPYGPGISTLLGYQLIIKNKFSLSFEVHLNYFQSLNKNTSHNPNNRYFNFLENFKMGIKLK